MLQLQGHKIWVKNLSIFCQIFSVLKLVADKACRTINFFKNFHWFFHWEFHMMDIYISKELYKQRETDRTIKKKV